MKKTTLITLLAAALLSTAASAQERVAKTLTLADATAHFRKGDTDASGMLSRTEARALGVSAAQAKAYDYNSDSQISLTEFLVAYKSMALAGGARVSNDLDKQVQHELDKRRLAEKKASDAKEAKEAREAAQERIDGTDRAKNKERVDAAEAQKIAEAREAAEKRKDGTERAKKKERVDAAEAKKIAEARAEAAKRKRESEAARKRSDAEGRKKKGGTDRPKRSGQGG